MSGHLSTKQISEWITGKRCRKVHLHLSECAACSMELDRMERALGEFRRSVRDWSRCREASLVREYGWKRWVSHRWPAWTWAATGALLISLLAAYQLVYRASLQTASVDELITDAALLHQINQQLSRTVAGPMEPLSTLVSWKEASPLARHGSFQSKSIKVRD